MFGYAAKKFSKVLPFIILTSFVWIAIFGIGMGMEIDEKGNMSGCVFVAGQANLCPMVIAEHIAKWQQIIIAIPRPHTNTILLLFIFAILAIFFISKLFPQLKILPNKLNIQSYRRQELETRASNPLLAAFSDGILNPKIY